MSFTTEIRGQDNIVIISNTHSTECENSDYCSGLCNSLESDGERITTSKSSLTTETTTESAPDTKTTTESVPDTETSTESVPDTETTTESAPDTETSTESAPDTETTICETSDVNLLQNFLNKKYFDEKENSCKNLDDKEAVLLEEALNSTFSSIYNQNGHPHICRCNLCKKHVNKKVIFLVSKDGKEEICVSSKDKLQEIISTYMITHTQNYPSFKLWFEVSPNGCVCKGYNRNFLFFWEQILFSITWREVVLLD